MNIAQELRLPVVIHARMAEREAFNIIKSLTLMRISTPIQAVELAKEISENGHFIGIVTGIVFIPEVRKVAENGYRGITG